LTSLSQVEINTIASSFGSATTKLARLHEYILNKTANHAIADRVDVCKIKTLVIVDDAVKQIIFEN
jgi:hypothetical protein